MNFTYFQVLGVPSKDVDGLVNLDSISAILNYDGDPEYKSIIVLNNNRQFRSKKYPLEVKAAIVWALSREANNGKV